MTTQTQTDGTGTVKHGAGVVRLSPLPAASSTDETARRIGKDTDADCEEFVQ
jgi:hypothetical protein